MSLADELRQEYFGDLDVDEILNEASLMHYGTPRHSGRYPYGSGENPYQHVKGFLGNYRELKSKGVTEKEIAKYFGMNTSQLRDKIAIENMKESIARYEMVQTRVDKGITSPTKISRETGIPEGTIRDYIKRGSPVDTRIMTTADTLAKAVEKSKYVNVGEGVNFYLGITEDKLKKSLAYLSAKGYQVTTVNIPQAGADKQYTPMKVLTKEGLTKRDIFDNRDKIRMVGQHSEDGGLSYQNREPIVNIDRKRIFVRYGDQGGKEKDGTIEIRRNVPDLDLGRSNYAQVRIGVEGGLYMKGMALYSDNIPKGYDVVYNTNKRSGAPDKDLKDENGFVTKSGVFKKQKDPSSRGYDPSNPFGSAIKGDEELITVPSHYEDKEGNKHKSALNICREEGDWSQWKKNLPSQFLSKQDPQLARKQLDLAVAEKRNEFDDIKSLTNAVIKKELLRDFADECDSAAVHLKAAALPRQRTHVILPDPNMKETEVYAPNYEHGEEVVLIRFPHGGTFEIPRLRVNKHVPTAEAAIGKNAKDAIVINSKVAETLSGADFDGDTVLVIPTRNNNIKAADSYKKGDKAIESLRNFDPDADFPPNPNVKPWKKGGTQEHRQMGEISNLITDMTLQQAPIDEVVRAVKHSMVIIDVAKHHYDYKKSFEDLGIDELKRKYQKHKDDDGYGGAATLISKAKGQARVRARKENYRIDPETGEKIWIEKPQRVDYKTGEPRFDKKGNPVYPMMVSTKMYEAKDAYELSSGHVIESVYADYANAMKAMGNEARKELLATTPDKRSPEAVKVYAKQVESLDRKLVDAKKNAPLERQAQALASKKVEMIEQEEDLTKEEKKKEKNKAITYARIVTGAKKHQIYIDDDEWQAIQAGAVSPSKLLDIWTNADQDRAKELALPKERNQLSDAKIALISKMAGRYSNQEIADQLGVSISTVQKYI